jgi:hypothetical protein
MSLACACAAAVSCGETATARAPAAARALFKSVCKLPRAFDERSGTGWSGSPTSTPQATKSRSGAVATQSASAEVRAIHRVILSLCHGGSRKARRGGLLPRNLSTTLRRISAGIIVGPVGDGSLTGASACGRDWRSTTNWRARRRQTPAPGSIVRCVEHPHPPTARAARQPGPGYPPNRSLKRSPE